MNKVMKSAIYVIALLVLVDLVYLNVRSVKNTRVGVVQIETLVYEFKGMKEASSDYTKKLSVWKSKMDTLESSLKNLYEEIRMDSVNKDKVKLQSDLAKFKVLKSSYLETQETLSNKAKEADQTMTAGILNQLKEYVAEYGKKKGYQVIITNNQMDNVLYANEQEDVTADILKFVNEKYEKK